MPRYREKEKKVRTDRISLFTLLFPLVSVLYAEGIFAWFSGFGFSVYKILFALAAGCIAAALSRLTPLRIVNAVLQSAWLLFCFGFIALQFLCFQAGGVYCSLFIPVENLPAVSALVKAAAKNLPFMICMLVPAVLQLFVQCPLLLTRRSLLGTLLGADWMELLGMLLLALILGFVSFTMAMRADAGETAPRRQIELQYMPAESAETFGILPQTVLDLKYNVLHIQKEEVIHHYIVTEDGTQVEITEQEAGLWAQEG
ncbi:MAG: hypothetical protein IJF56_04750 [Clostridia bacterium]|nr:hypothetical protein [Clostridia bacterium]